MASRPFLLGLVLFTIQDVSPSTSVEVFPQTPPSPRAPFLELPAEPSTRVKGRIPRSSTEKPKAHFNDIPSDPVGDPGPQVSGRVIPLGPGDLSDLWVFLLQPPRRDSAKVSGDGTFQFPPLRLDREEKAPTVLIRAAGESLGDFIPTVWKTTRADFSEPITALIFPRVWSVDGGTFDGARVDFSLVAFFGIGQADGFYRHRLPQFWPPTAYPIETVLVQPRVDGGEVRNGGPHLKSSTEVLVRANEASLQAQVAVFNDILGTRVFSLPVTKLQDSMAETGAGVWFHFWNRSGGSVETLGSTRSSYVCRSSEEFRCLAEERTSSRIHFTAMSPSTGGATTWPLVVQHELMHAMGFGHTCNFPSIMFNLSAAAKPECCMRDGLWGEGLTNPVTSLTPQDVAGAQIWLSVGRLTTQYEPEISILESLVGEMTIEKGYDIPKWVQALRRLPEENTDSITMAEISQPRGTRRQSRFPARLEANERVWIWDSTSTFG